MNMPVCPCKGCADRVPEGEHTHDCHGQCTRYAEWKAAEYEYKTEQYEKRHPEIRKYIDKRIFERKRGRT